MRKIFITGAEGFTGTALLSYLANQNYDVVAGVWNRARKLALERTGYKALVCDVSDAINVARCIASVAPDAILHLAGTSFTQVGDEPLTSYQTTVTAWANVLDGARRAVPRARLLMVSSAEVYGPAAANGQPVSESTPCQPNSTFGSWTSAAETIAMTFHRDYHVDVMVARPFQMIGMNQPDGSFWHSLAQAVSCGVQPGVDSNGKFDLLHVSDVAAAYCKLLESGKPAETYNVCSGQLASISDICNMMKSCGLNGTPRSGTQNVGSTPIANLCGSNQKLTGCGWKATQTIESAVRALMETASKPVPATV